MPFIYITGENNDEFVINTALIQLVHQDTKVLRTYINLSSNGTKNLKSTVIATPMKAIVIHALIEHAEKQKERPPDHV